MLPEAVGDVLEIAVQRLAVQMLVGGGLTQGAKIPQAMENPVNAMRILLPFITASTSLKSSLILHSSASR